MTPHASPQPPPGARQLAVRFCGGRPWFCPTVGAGALLQLSLYLAAPSLLLDESRLVLNIVSRSWAGLLRPLDHDQTAPLLFLWAEKSLSLLGGVNEYALRALPFCAAAASLPLIYLVGRRLADAQAGGLATALAAFSPTLLQLSRQVKPYTLDAAVALLLLWWALDWADHPRELRPAARAMAAGFVVVWTSIPAVFSVVGVLAAFAFGSRGERPPVSRLMTTAVVCLVSFAVTYLLVYAPAANNPYMKQFWQGSLVTIWHPGWLGRLWQGTRDLVWQTIVGESTEQAMTPASNLLVNVTTAAILIFAVSGLRSIRARAGRLRTTLLAAPVATALGASLFGRYPIAARVMLFAVPCLVISVATGVIALINAVPLRRRRPLAVMACACLLALSVPAALTLAFHAREPSEDVRWAVKEYDRYHTPGEPIYVFAASLPAWAFYTTDWAAPDTARLARVARLASSGGPAFENAPPRDRPLRPGDGDSLVYPFRDVSEVIGLSEGAQWRSGTGRVQYAPDTNWTVNEGRRIREAASPGIWAVVSRSFGVEGLLFAATEMCIDHRLADRGASLVHFVPRPAGFANCASLPSTSGVTKSSD